jgi:predicted nucleic acid-binding protein
MKRALTDSSYLVALIDADHPKHQRVLRWQRRILRGEWQGVLAAHALAETYSVLTRIPHTPPISPEIAWQAIASNLAHFEVIALTAEEYRGVRSDLAARGIGGGLTYDALIAAVARKAGVDLLLTLNPEHFRRVAPDLAERIREP